MNKKLTNTQRWLIADKLMDSVNLALAGLVFGQLVTEKVDPLLLMLGVLLYGWGWATALQMRRGVKA
jgi:hypothetical protein